MQLNTSIKNNHFNNNINNNINVLLVLLLLLSSNYAIKHIDN